MVKREFKISRPRYSSSRKTKRKDPRWKVRDTWRSWFNHHWKERRWRPAPEATRREGRESGKAERRAGSWRAGGRVSRKAHQRRALGHVRGPQENGRSGFRRTLWREAPPPGSREPESITSAHWISNPLRQLHQVQSEVFQVIPCSKAASAQTAYCQALWQGCQECSPVWRASSDPPSHRHPAQQQLMETSAIRGQRDLGGPSIPSADHTCTPWASPLHRDGRHLESTAWSPSDLQAGGWAVSPSLTSKLEAELWGHPHPPPTPGKRGMCAQERQWGLLSPPRRVLCAAFVSGTLKSKNKLHQRSKRVNLSRNKGKQSKETE